MKLALPFLAALILFSASASGQTACFNGTGVNTSGPLAAAVLDSNLDGKLDVALAETTTVGNSSITASYIGAGNGTFSPLTAYHGPGTPLAVASGDFNGDGKPDVAIGFWAHNGNAGNVGILLGNGDGTFGNPHGVRTAIRVAALVTGDFNGDGKLDVAATTGALFHSEGDIELLLGNGDGSLQAPIVITSAPYDAVGLAAVDLNHDGNLDLVAHGGNASNTGQMLTVLLGNGDGSFQAPATYSAGTNSSGRIAVDDIDGDGNLDVVTPSDPGLFVFYGTGTGTLSAPATIALTLPPTSVVSIDIFRNGRKDLVAAIYTGLVGIAVNNGNRTFTVQYTNAGNSVISAADFNNDGKTDLLFLQSEPNSITVLLNCS